MNPDDQKPTVTRRRILAIAAAAAILPKSAADPFLEIRSLQLLAKARVEAACVHPDFDQYESSPALQAAEVRLAEAFEAHGKLCRDACYVAPTTAAGLMAFVQFMRDEVFNEEIGRMAGESGEAATAAAWRTLADAVSFDTLRALA